jgi:hypothetical protein
MICFLERPYVEVGAETQNRTADTMFSPVSVLIPGFLCDWDTLKGQEGGKCPIPGQEVPSHLADPLSNGLEHCPRLAVQQWIRYPLL